MSINIHVYMYINCEVERHYITHKELTLSQTSPGFHVSDVQAF